MTKRDQEDYQPEHKVGEDEGVGGIRSQLAADVGEGAPFEDDYPDDDR